MPDNSWKGKGKQKMHEELKSKSSIVSMRLTRKSISQTETNQLLAVATTRVPGEVRAKYLCDQGVSIVQATVHVDAIGAASLELHAVVRVELAYKGDMVRSSERTRGEINERLQDLAQRHCAETVLKEMIRDSASAKN